MEEDALSYLEELIDSKGQEIRMMEDALLIQLDKIERHNRTKESIGRSLFKVKGLLAACSGLLEELAAQTGYFKTFQNQIGTLLTLQLKKEAKEIEEAGSF
jgi:hypothetical protein